MSASPDPLQALPAKIATLVSAIAEAAVHPQWHREFAERGPASIDLDAAARFLGRFPDEQCLVDHLRTAEEYDAFCVLYLTQLVAHTLRGCDPDSDRFLDLVERLTNPPSLRFVCLLGLELLRPDVGTSPGSGPSPGPVSG